MLSPTISSSNPSVNAPPDTATYHLSQIRQALTALEAQFGPRESVLDFSKGKGKEAESRQEVPPRLLGRTEGEGLYAGPTTLVAHLMPNGGSSNVRHITSWITSPTPAARRILTLIVGQCSYWNM